MEPTSLWDRDSVSALGVCLRGLAVELVSDERFSTYDPCVVARFDDVCVTGADVHGGAIFVLDVESSGGATCESRTTCRA
jgi:hypothetical protein